jgi:hypothetical protein
MERGYIKGRVKSGLSFRGIEAIAMCASASASEEGGKKGRDKGERAWVWRRRVRGMRVHDRIGED